MSDWTLGEWMSVTTFVLFAAITAVTYVVARFSERWSQRIAGFALFTLASGMAAALLSWNTVMPR